MLPVATSAEGTLEERKVRSTRSKPPRRLCTKKIPGLHTSEPAPAGVSGLRFRLNFGGERYHPTRFHTTKNNNQYSVYGDASSGASIIDFAVAWKRFQCYCPRPPKRPPRGRRAAGQNSEH